MFSEDLSAFFSSADFAVEAIYQGSLTVSGIFDNEYEAFAFDGKSAASRVPRFVCGEADVSGVAHGHTLAIAGVTYKVNGIEPDGTGLMLLRLEKQ